MFFLAHCVFLSTYVPVNSASIIYHKMKNMEKLKTLIQTDKDLETLVHMARQTDAVALDTEFVWERTYYPQLGLIQIALSDEACFLIDPLAIDNLQILGELLSDRNVIKIFHDAPQDLTILQRATQTEANNIFDTRLAAGFSNLPATLSLSNLVKELLDIRLEKNETRTNWLQRPLTNKQIEYALNDVRYLRAVRVLLLTRIIGPKIKSWLQEELNLLNNPTTYRGLVDSERYRKISGSTNLNRVSLAILRNLSTWREGTAKKLDRPRNHVIKDATLIEVAKKKPKSKDDLKDNITLSAKALAKYGDNLISIVTASIKQPDSSYPDIRKPVRLNAYDKTGLEKLNSLISLKCDVLGVAPTLIGNNSELKQLIKTLHDRPGVIPQELRQTEGWRKSFLEDFIRQAR